ncbi:hypothetical protein EC957_001570 [Mortierella hygrophila]|uniref:F-box domain-containing protein n=1 Tax=Mortierella hygrophila TaxID=979708 RepID=A0A9P6FFG5_9FUNG|nr:hypothetical protein EC957_001570 [Mortierella hygrophila]
MLQSANCRLIIFPPAAHRNETPPFLNGAPRHPPSSVQEQPTQALQIVELLERTFSYVDDTTLRRTVVLVCRLWLHMNRGRVVREVCCDYRWRTVSFDEALTRIPGAGRFCYSGAELHDVDEDVLRRLELVFYPVVRFWKSFVASKPTWKDPGCRLSTIDVVLENTKLRQSDLEDLLTLTPRLSKLKLIELRGGTINDYHNSLGVNYNWSRLFQHFLSLPITLDSFHFSVQRQQMSEAEMRQKTVDVCSHATEWSLYPTETTPGLLQELVSLPNIITTLELYTIDDAGAFQLLHIYLCDSPDLLHLRVARIPVLYDDFDLHDRVRYYDLDSAMYTQSTDIQVLPLPERETFWTKLPVHRWVWQCRKLQTLKIDMHGHDFNRLNRPISSRLIFGYTARVCPHLEELEIRVPRTCE